VKPAVVFKVTALPEQIVVEPTGMILIACEVVTVIVVTVEVDGQPLEPVAVTL
jgi:hypothetical protein